MKVAIAPSIEMVPLTGFETSEKVKLSLSTSVKKIEKKQPYLLRSQQLYY